jgi:ribosome-binding protein aMBF1 (putative translation factor)
MVVELHARRLHPRNAAALANLSRTLLRAIESAEMANLGERLTRLEKLLEAQLERKAPQGSG